VRDCSALSARAARDIAGTLIFAAMLQVPDIFPDEIIKALGIFAKRRYSGIFVVTGVVTRKSAVQIS
jgi:hypothetical protein